MKSDERILASLRHADEAFVGGARSWNADTLLHRAAFRRRQRVLRWSGAGVFVLTLWAAVARPSGGGTPTAPPDLSAGLLDLQREIGRLRLQSKGRVDAARTAHLAEIPKLQRSDLLAGTLFHRAEALVSIPGGLAQAGDDYRTVRDLAGGNNVWAEKAAARLKQVQERESK